MLEARELPSEHSKERPGRRSARCQQQTSERAAESTAAERARLDLVWRALVNSARGTEDLAEGESASDAGQRLVEHRRGTSEDGELLLGLPGLPRPMRIECRFDERMETGGMWWEGG